MARNQVNSYSLSRRVENHKRRLEFEQAIRFCESRGVSRERFAEILCTKTSYFTKWMNGEARVPNPVYERLKLFMREMD